MNVCVLVVLVMAQALAVEEHFEDDLNDELKPGHTLMQGQYTIDAFLNAGGFGITYLARNSLDRRVVIKECFPGAFCRRSTSSVVARSRSYTKEFSSIVRSFVDEAHSLAKVKHPNVVGVHQVFEENKTAYMAIDYVEGRDLLDLIQDRSNLPAPEQIETIFKKLLDAIDHIHGQDMLHRDISPDNILLNADMEPILIDFGAARQETGEENRILSELRVVKDGYSPQEFYVAGAEQGPYSDLYALAATFYHVISDELPVNSQTRIGAVAAGEADPYVPLAGRVEGYSEKFLMGLDKALATLPKNRFSSAQSWLDYLAGSEAGTATNISQDVSKAALAPEPAATSKTKARVLALVGLAVPIMGGAYVMSSGGDNPTVAESAVASTIESTEAPVEVANADIASADAPLVTEETVPEADLSALLNIAAAATAQAEAASAQAEEAARTAEAVIPVEVLQTETSEPVEVASDVAASAVPDLAAAEDVSPVSTDPIDPAPEAAVAEDAPLAAVSETTAELESIAPTLILETFDLPQINSAWTVDLAGVPADAAYAIGEVTLPSLEEVETTLHQLMQAPLGSTLEMSILSGNADNADVIETIAVPVIHRTSFPDSTTFETRMIDNVWTTTVAVAPAGSGLEIDDVLLGDLDTELLFDKRTSLPDTLVQANAQNLERLTLAVRRKEDLTATSVLLPR